MTINACYKMYIVHAFLVFERGIHRLHIQLAIGNGRMAIFTGSYRGV